MKKPVSIVALQSWENLNKDLRIATEVRCRFLLKEEQRGRKRAAFLKRIHSRLNKVRADRERVALMRSMA